MNPARIISVAALLTAAAPPAARAQEKPVPAFTGAEAAAHAGEEAAVTGKVVAVSKSAKGTTYLNFGDRFPRQTFSGVVLARDEAKVGDVKPFEGKVVTITGRIELSPDNKPQIVVSAPEQIKLAEPGDAPPPLPKPAATPMPATPAPTPQPQSAATPKPAELKKIALAPNWSGTAQGGEMTRKDLALLFAGQGAAGEIAEGDPSVVLFADVTFLAPLAVAKKRLQLDRAAESIAKVTCPGLPAGSFTAHTFSGIFVGGFNRLHLVTDLADQVVSVLLVDENPRQRSPEVTDTAGYHAYNFISGRTKGTNELVIKHEVAKGAAPGVVMVDSMLIDPHEGEPAGKPAPGARTPAKGASNSRTPRSGKVLERSRWIVPVPVVNLILRCVGNR